MKIKLFSKKIENDSKKYRELLSQERGFKNSNGLRPFTNICLENDKFSELWRSSKNLNEFKEKVFSCEELKGTQGYAELSKESEDHEYRVREMLRNASDCYQVYSDAGSVLVGTKDTSFLISHENGDGKAYVAVINDRSKFNRSMLNFWSSIQGNDLRIHEYDCDINSEVLCTLTGRYGVYCGHGFVVFEKWDD